ncbi:MAG: hypothetical protein ACAI44_10760 [Candidatus Sericytochromatia bacterium]
MTQEMNIYTRVLVAIRIAKAKKAEDRERAWQARGQSIFQEAAVAIDQEDARTRQGKAYRAQQLRA